MKVVVFCFFFNLSASSRGGGTQPMLRLRKDEITRSRFTIPVLVSAKCVVPRAADLADIWAGCITVANALYVFGRAERSAPAAGSQSLVCPLFFIIFATSVSGEALRPRRQIAQVKF